VIETANTASRGMSEGVWGYAGDKDVAALYWFFRFNPDGTFASRASVTDKIVPRFEWRVHLNWRGPRL
jgi:hypothetical protein